jgi:hypothetical protein
MEDCGHPTVSAVFDVRERCATTFLFIIFQRRRMILAFPTTGVTNFNFGTNPANPTTADRDPLFPSEFVFEKGPFRTSLLVFADMFTRVRGFLLLGGVTEEVWIIACE